MAEYGPLYKLAPQRRRLGEDREPDARSVDPGKAGQTRAYGIQDC